MPRGPNSLAESGTPLFFKLANAADVGIAAPDSRMGESLGTWARSLSAFHKAALIASFRGGRVWHLAQDEGPYLEGHDEAPCPLTF